MQPRQLTSLQLSAGPGPALAETELGVIEHRIHAAIELREDAYLFGLRARVEGLLYAADHAIGLFAGRVTFA